MFRIRATLAEDLCLIDDLDARVVVGAPDVVFEVANVDPPVAGGDGAVVPVNC